MKNGIKKLVSLIILAGGSFSYAGQVIECGSTAINEGYKYKIELNAMQDNGEDFAVVKHATTGTSFYKMATVQNESGDTVIELSNPYLFFQVDQKLVLILKDGQYNLEKLSITQSLGYNGSASESKTINFTCN